MLCDKNAFGYMQDIIIICCYLPPQGSTSYANGKEGIEILHDNIVNISEKYPDAYLMVVGDLNARTSTEPDFIQDDDPSYLPGGSFYEPSGFTVPRNSSDKEVNFFGENLLDLCKSHDIHIVNGRSCSDQTGHMTFVSSMGASLIDYFIMSAQLFTCVKDLTVLPCDVTNHFPIVLDLKITISHKIPSVKKVLPRKKYVWKPHLCNGLLAKLDDEKTNDLVNNFYEKLNCDQINVAVNEIENIYDHVASEMINCNNNLGDKIKNQPWWTNECSALKDAKYKSLTSFRRDKNNVKLEKYLQIRNQYRNLCKRLRNSYYYKKT